MSSPELQSFEEFDQPDIPELGNDAPSAEVELPAGADNEDGEFALAGDAGDLQFGEMDDAADEPTGGQEAAFVDSDLFAEQGARVEDSGQRQEPSQGRRGDDLTQGDVNDLFAEIAREEDELSQNGVRDVQRPDGSGTRSVDTGDGTGVTLFHNPEAGKDLDPVAYNTELQEKFGRTAEDQAQHYEDFLATQARFEAARAEDARARAEEPGSDGQLAALREYENARDAHVASGHRLIFDEDPQITRAYGEETFVNGELVVPTETASHDDKDVLAETTGSDDAVQSLGHVAIDGDGEQTAEIGEPDSERYTDMPVIERPHVGDRIGEGDRSAARTSGENARLQQLERLPHNGFSQREIVQVREQIAALGYPVDNFKVFNHKENERGTEDTIASWLGHGYGEFTVYDLYDKQIPEKRLGTLGHETAHANSPLKPENMDVFGGEAGQAEAARYVNAVANQSLETNIHLNGYHKYLINEYRTNVSEIGKAHERGEINGNEFNAANAEASRKFMEETWAIMNEMALTNRNGLAEVQARQHQVMDDLARKPGASDLPQKVDLMTTTRPNDGTPEASRGIDRWLVKLLDGVNDQQELVQHIDNLKQRFYGEANNRIAEHRRQGQYAPAA